MASTFSNWGIDYSPAQLANMQSGFQQYIGPAGYTQRRNGAGDEVIKVDKGTPDKALYAIFYAEIEDIKEPEEDHDPVIFCKTKTEVDKEMEKLLKRRDVDLTSVRIFGLVGVVNVEVKIDEGLMKKEKK